MVEAIVDKLLTYGQVSKIIITKNIPEQLYLPDSPKISVISNDNPEGFGFNHNQAFKFVTEEFFCVLNPDIIFVNNPFNELVAAAQRHDSAIISPMIKSPNGKIEDSVRYFPTIKSLLNKFFFKYEGKYIFEADSSIFSPEWVAGMFMLFKTYDFSFVKGFDTKYYLYYEDVDICVRIWEAGRNIIICPYVHVIHDARRTSRRNLRFALWHCRSMLRYLIKYHRNVPKIGKI